MAQPYVGEIRMFAGNFAPAGWMLCQGQDLPISQNEVLFQLIGTTYGGDGSSSFKIPDLRGRVPIHQSKDFALAAAAGTETVTLSVAQLPAHTHPMMGTNNNASGTAPQNNVAAAEQIFGVLPYGTDAPKSPINSNTVSPVGQNLPHTNLQPFLCVNFIISLFGIFPSRS